MLATVIGSLDVGKGERPGVASEPLRWIYILLVVRTGIAPLLERDIARAATDASRDVRGG